MSGYKQVSCIRRYSGKDDPNRQLDGIGGLEDGAHWYLPEAEAISHIENKTIGYYIREGLHEADLMVDIDQGRKYLKTAADRHRGDKLIVLPDCP